MRKLSALLAGLALLFGAAAHFAEAQESERTVELAKGETLWGILESYGCSESQIALTWPLVAEDSGLDWTEHRQWPVGTTFTMERDCDGNFGREDADAARIRAENEELRKENSDLALHLDTIQEDNANLKEALAAASASGASSMNLRIWQAVTALVSLILIAAFVRIASLKRERNSLIGKNEILAEKVARLEVQSSDKKPAAREGDFVFPSSFPVEHGGETRIFVRKAEPRQQRVWYACPICNADISSVKNCLSHLRSAHPLSQKEEEDVSVAGGMFPNVNNAFPPEAGIDKTRRIGR